MGGLHLGLGNVVGVLVRLLRIVHHGWIRLCGNVIMGRGGVNSSKGKREIVNCVRGIKIKKLPIRIGATLTVPGISGGDLGEVAVVVSLHFEIEDLALSVAGLGDKMLVQQAL